MSTRSDAPPADGWDRMIREYIAAHPDRPMKTRALARELEVPDDRYAGFRAAVRGMLQRGELVYARNRALRLPGQKTLRGPTGVFRLYRRGFGSVTLDGGAEYYIPRQHTADAHDGDTVLIRPLGRYGRMGQPSAAIVRVLRRARERWVGVLEQRGRHWIVQPRMHVAAPLVEVDPNTVDPAARGKLVTIEPLGPGTQERTVRGAVIDVLGDPSHSRVKVRAVALAAGLPDDFPPDVRELADALAERFRVEDVLPEREDLRSRLTITIDPPDARDFDDAISIETIDAEHVELGVHIADVSFFVSPDSPLDAVARERANSVYLPGYVVPMLPAALSNGLCSLRPGEDRLTRSAFIRYDRHGRVSATRFANSVIRSHLRLTYQEASAVLEGRGRGVSEPVQKLLREAERLARRIRARRFKEGMLSLQVPEVEIEFDADGRVLDAGPADTSFSHTIVEMFMVEANEAVCRAITHLDWNHIRRVHPEPDPDGFLQLKTSLAELGLAIGGQLDRHVLQKIIDDAAGTPRASLINFMLLRALAQAVYQTGDEGHYALASEAYCHFTSPIRRYPDLLVHRQLDALIRGENPPEIEDEALKEIARHCSERERRAVEAEREAKKWLLSELMGRKLGEQLDGVITGVVSAGVFVQTQPYMAEGFIPAADFGPDRWEFDAEARRFIGLRSGRTITLGQNCPVIVAAVDEMRGEVEFTPAVPLGEASSGQRSDSRSRAAGRSANGPPKRGQRAGGAGNSRGPNRGRNRSRKGRRR